MGDIPLPILILVVLFGLAVLWRLVEILQRKGQKNWLPATGTVTSLSKTGGTSNSISEYDVHVNVTDGTHAWETVLETPIERHKLPRFQPGKKIRLVYNPRKPEQVALDLYSADRTKDRKNQQVQEIQQYGLEADAVLTQFAPTGRTRNEAAQYEFTVMVTDPTGAPHDMTAREYLNPQTAHTIAPGMTVPIRYIPDTDRFLTDFSSARPAERGPDGHR